MTEMKLEITYMPTEELKPYENNAKLHPQEQIDQIKASITKFGMNDPIAICGKENIIVEGHGRLIACQQLGIETVPVIRLDHLNDEQRRAYTLAHNQLTMNTGFDLDMLQKEIQKIDLDMADFGFDNIDESMPEIEEDNFDLNEEEGPAPEAKSKLGEIYQLGNHRIMCGDSTNPDDVKRLMDGQVADLLITDPPYNVAYGQYGSATEARALHRRTDRKTIMNDKMENDEFRKFLAAAYTSADAVMKSGAPFYIFHADNESYNFRGACLDMGWQVRQCLIWVKNALCLGRQDYQWIHEPCLYGWKEGSGHYFIYDRTQTTALEKKPSDIENLTRDEAIAIIKRIYKQAGETTVVRENKPTNSELHPTMKPIALFARLINNSTKSGENVLDLFGGSGTTMMACEQLGRKAFLMELDPHYVDATIERWEQATGKKAVKL